MSPSITGTAIDEMERYVGVGDGLMFCAPDELATLNKTKARTNLTIVAMMPYSANEGYRR